MAQTIFHSQNRLLNTPHFNKPRPSPSSDSNVFHYRRHRNRCSGDNQILSSTVLKLPAQNNLIIGQVKILKRGEAVPPSLIKKEDTHTSKKQIGVCSTNVESDDVAFSAGWEISPSPSEVPFPRFLAIDRNEKAMRGLV